GATARTKSRRFRASARLADDELPLLARMDLRGASRPAIRTSGCDGAGMPCSRNALVENSCRCLQHRRIDRGRRIGTDSAAATTELNLALRRHSSQSNVNAVPNAASETRTFFPQRPQ